MVQLSELTASRTLTPEEMTPVIYMTIDPCDWCWVYGSELSMCDGAPTTTRIIAESRASAEHVEKERVGKRILKLPNIYQADKQHEIIDSEWLLVKEETYLNSLPNQVAPLVTIKWVQKQPFNQPRSVKTSLDEHSKPNITYYMVLDPNSPLYVTSDGLLNPFTYITEFHWSSFPLEKQNHEKLIGTHLKNDWLTVKVEKFLPEENSSELEGIVICWLEKK